MQDHTQDPLLFDLQSDPSEAMPLDTESAPINAAIVARAQAALGRHNAEMVWAAPAMDAPNDCCVPDLCRKREEGHGCCGATDEKECGAHGFSSGMWKKPSATSLEGCVALCKKCAVCAFVSYSKSRGDCSWYDAGACDLDKLTYEDGSYLSQAVNGTAPLPAASPQVCTSKNVTRSQYSTRKGIHWLLGKLVFFSTLHQCATVAATCRGATPDAEPATLARTFTATSSSPQHLLETRSKCIVRT